MLAALLAFALAACDRESRLFRQPATTASKPPDSRVAEVQSAPKGVKHQHAGPYDANAWSVAQGKRVYVWFNCNGCHAMGGGGMGPSLMDEKWLYGHAPQDVFTSIAKGRANGMPAFGERISEQQVWQLVAYVRSMSGLIPDDALPGRSDALSAVKPELRRDELEPIPDAPPSKTK
jgi:cytochrome c oxidase cbb3-type subunit III